MYMSYFSEMGGALFSQPWRTMPGNQETLRNLKSYQPKNEQVTHVRILLHGPAGAGKSGFINSVDSVFQGRATGRALTDSISGTSFTQKYATYKIRKDPESFCSFIFNDIMGFESSYGVHEEDIKLALMGHVKDGYRFLSERRLVETDTGYNSDPTMDDRVHVLVSVVPVMSVSLLSEEIVKKMRAVRLAASDLGIPQVAILTKVDEACPKVKGNIKNVYKSKYLKEQVEKFSMLLGLPVNCIFLVKNYSSEIQTNDDCNAYILCAMNQIISLAEDSLDNPPNQPAC
uniref:G domain-containing protein n=1 Tax=Anabas testudineus TaxID=64144 RepID=A0A7N5ZRY8_ANATE